MNKRLKQARIQAGFPSATAAIDKCGWNSSKYRAHENGQNNFKVDDAKVYAAAYGVSPAWLLVGDEKLLKTSASHKNNGKCKIETCPETIYAMAVLLRSEPDNISLVEKLNTCVESYSNLLVNR